MSLQPTGPLPAATYWRRRALVLGVVVLLLIVVLKACTGGGHSDAGPTRPPAGVPTTPATTPATSPATTPATTPAAVTTPAVPTTPAAVPAADCPDSALSLVATTDATSYATGTTARLTMTLKNTGPVACTRAVGQGALSFTVVSGPDRIWSSDDCSPGGPPGPETLAPGAVKTVTLPWSLKRSAPGCAQGRPALQTGTYSLTAHAGSLASAPVSFRISAG